MIGWFWITTQILNAILWEYGWISPRSYLCFFIAITLIDWVQTTISEILEEGYGDLEK